MNRLALCALAGAAALAAGTAVVAQQAAAPARNFAAAQVTSAELAPQAWMLQGEGGNMALIVGKDSALLVDTQFAQMFGKIRTAVTGLTDKPVRYVVNTHLHADHTGGNQQFWMNGSTIVAHAKLLASFAAGTTNALTGAKTPPAPKAALPTRVYAGTTTNLQLGGRNVQLMHLPKAHTNGDTALWVPDANVLVTGDIVSWGNRYPNIDVGDGGGINGMISATDVFLKRANDKTKIVPGHGPLMTRDQLVTYRAVLADAREAVRKAKAAGMTEDQAVEAKPLAADVQGRAGATDAMSVNFVRLIYRSL